MDENEKKFRNKRMKKEHKEYLASMLAQIEVSEQRTLADEDILISEEICLADDDDDDDEKISEENLLESFDTLDTSTPSDPIIFRLSKKTSEITELLQEPQASCNNKVDTSELKTRRKSVLKRKVSYQTDNSTKKKRKKKTRRYLFSDSYQKRIIDNLDAQTAVLGNLENLFSKFIEIYSARNRIEERKTVVLEKLIELLSEKFNTSEITELIELIT